jgi:predicted ATPase
MVNANSNPPQLDFDFVPHLRGVSTVLEPHMGLSAEVRRLDNKWRNNNGWAKRLEYLEVRGIRGWAGQRIDFLFPIVAIVGENGAGKSTILQCAASSYGEKDGQGGWYPSDFFPDTPWEVVGEDRGAVVPGASITYAVREGERTKTQEVKKLKRWRGYHLRPDRHVDYIDLSRVQPVSARTGFQRLANPQFTEATEISEQWDSDAVKRISHLMGRDYEQVRMAAVTNDTDPNRRVPILQLKGKNEASGFHNGQGETTIAEFLKRKMIRNSLVLIDEIETSLHPRVQRRLIRDLADIARTNDIQFIVTTHSPYILEELPPHARLYIMNEASGREVVTGVSPEFAMTRMDDSQHPECDVYVEDRRSAEWIRATLAARRPDLFPRCLMIPYGTASVGYSLAQMVANGRFPRPSCVYVDGDQQAPAGCTALSGEDAPERVIFGDLRDADWAGIEKHMASFSFSKVVDACSKAMSYNDPHEWVRLAADSLLVGGDILWHDLCACWVDSCLSEGEAERVLRPIVDALNAA